MALLDGIISGFLTPLGFLALAVAVPLIVLYLIQPNPTRYELPTLRFLTSDGGRSSSNPLLERLRRSLLLLIQLLVILALATSLASPYVMVDEGSTVRETVVVVDRSASMGTLTDAGGTTRFAAARSSALDAVTDTTSVVVTGGDTQVVARGVARDEAESTLGSLSVTDASGDLASAISSAAAIAGEEARIVVVSDFADDSAWADAVESTRASGVTVDLRQFDGGGDDNVGIVSRSFSGGSVTVTVRNFGEAEATRTLSLGGERRELTLRAGDVVEETFEVPAGGGRLALSPGDSFPTDDTLYLAAPDDPTVDVLVVTNDPNRYLLTALDVVDRVDVTVTTPPTPIRPEYDVVVFSNVDGGRLLRSTTEAARDVVADGGGVAVQAQEGMPVSKYGNLLLVMPDGFETNPTLSEPRPGELTRGISFTPPERAVTGDLKAGTAQVSTVNGSAIVATDEADGGQFLYYGYVEAESGFKFNYQYPVFWKRAVFYLAGREPLPDLNRPAGGRLRFESETTVGTPGGSVTGTVVPLDTVGFYSTDERRWGVSLLSARESAVTAPDISDDGAGGVQTREESREVPREITPFVVVAGLLLVVIEVAYLRRRGDL